MQVRYAKDADDDIAPAVARAPSGTGEPTLKNVHTGRGTGGGRANPAVFQRGGDGGKRPIDVNVNSSFDREIRVGASRPLNEGAAEAEKVAGSHPVV